MAFCLHRSEGFCKRLCLRVNLRAFFDEFAGFFLHPFVEGFFFGDLLFGGVFAEVFGDVDGASAPERRPAGNASRGLFALSLLDSIVGGLSPLAPIQRARLRASAQGEFFIGKLPFGDARD